MKRRKPPETRPSTLCMAAMRLDQSFSGTRVEAIFSISLTSSFSEYTLIGSTDFSVISLSPEKIKIATTLKQEIGMQTDNFKICFYGA